MIFRDLMLWGERGKSAAALSCRRGIRQNSIYTKGILANPTTSGMSSSAVRRHLAIICNHCATIWPARQSLPNRAGRDNRYKRLSRQSAADLPPHQAEPDQQGHHSHDAAHLQSKASPSLPASAKVGLDRRRYALLDFDNACSDRLTRSAESSARWDGNAAV